MTLGERIRQQRKVKQMTQQDLADILKLAKSTVSQYESNTNRPDPETLVRIADALDVSTDYLLGRVNLPASTQGHDISPAEAEFLKWVEENLEESFFYDFDSSAEENKASLMEALRFMWEQEKKRGKRDKE